MNELTGTVNRVLYRNENFLIAILQTTESEKIKIIGTIYGVDN